MTTESVIVGTVIAAAALFLAWHGWSCFRNRNKTACPSCDCCTPKKIKRRR